MSYNWQLVRGASSDPLSLKFSAMQNKQNIAENELFKPERARPRIISKYTEDLVLSQDPFSFQQLKYINNLHYFGPYEPDGVHLKYWCMFNHIATRIKDSSFSNNYTVPIGKPRLCAGPSDGVKGGIIVTRINSDPTSLDYFYTPDSAKLQITNMGSGFSIYLNIMPESIGTTDQMVRMKVDASDGLNGHMIKIGVDGELKFFVRRAGTTRNFISPDNKLTEGQYYAICLTYNMSSNVLGMRINNEVQTDSADESPTFPTGHRLDMFHGIGVNQTAEKFRGRYADSRLYNDYIFTGVEMDNIWNNKRSISPIPYGHLSVAGVAHFNSNVYTGGYDPVAYDGTGFETI
jgi:hypothetical protein